jgi:hypothetical protein
MAIDLPEQVDHIVFMVGDKGWKVEARDRDGARVEAGIYFDSVAIGPPDLGDNPMTVRVYTDNRFDVAQPRRPEVPAS